MSEDLRATLRRFALALLRLPLLIFATIYFLIDEVVLAAIRPIVAWAAELRLFTRFAAWLDGLAPYPTLILFLVPFAVLEPFKIGALVLLAQGKLVIGGTMLATSHLLSIVLVERLFHATRDKLLTIAWFATIYGWVSALYDWSLGRLKATAAWRIAAEALRRLRAGLRIGSAVVRRRLGPIVRMVRARLAVWRAQIRALIAQRAG